MRESRLCEHYVYLNDPRDPRRNLRDEAREVLFYPDLSLFCSTWDAKSLRLYHLVSPCRRRESSASLDCPLQYRQHSVPGVRYEEVTSEDADTRTTTKSVRRRKLDLRNPDAQEVPNPSPGGTVRMSPHFASTWVRELIICVHTACVRLGKAILTSHPACHTMQSSTI